MTKHTTPPAAAPTPPTGPTEAELAEQKRRDAEEAAPAKAKAVEERSPLKVAINQIVQTGKDGKAEVIEPGVCFRPAAVDLDFLLKADAIREPTEAEQVMHERVEALQAADADTDPLG